MTINEMYTNYHKLNKATAYIIGFIFAHKLYMISVDNINEDWLKIEKASRNQGDNLRLRMSSAIRTALVESAICLGTENDLLDTKYNKGECFERIVTEYFGQQWVKDNVPFTESGDIMVEGVEVQIKLNSATLINSKLLAKLMAV